MAAKTDTSSSAADAPTQPGQDQATYSDDDRKAGYILVKLGPKALIKGANIHGDAWSIFQEFDDQHPNNPGLGGELLVVAGKVVKAYPTAGVMRALGSKFLEQVDAVKAPIYDDPPNLIDIPGVGAPPVQNPPAITALASAIQNALAAQASTPAQPATAPAIVAANNATLAPEDSAGAPTAPATTPDAPASSSSPSSKSSK